MHPRDHRQAQTVQSLTRAHARFTHAGEGEGCGGHHVTVLIVRSVPGYIMCTGRVGGGGVVRSRALLVEQVLNLKRHT